jgi:hypothetical protein
VNISTRLRVGGGERVMIGGFIITGSQPKKVILRGLGPSLSGFEQLADPTLKLFNADGVQIFTNDDWRDTQEAEIIASGVAPQFDTESAMIQTLAPGNYTAVLQSFDQTNGIALFEAYDLDRAASSQLVNISTRGFVGTDADVLIGGFTVESLTGASGTLVVRAIGPSLVAAGLSDTLENPQLELYSGSALIATNDDWQSDSAQAAALSRIGLAPTKPAESALITTVFPGQYTAVIRGVARTKGIGLVEIYNVTPAQ